MCVIRVFRMLENKVGISRRKHRRGWNYSRLARGHQHQEQDQQREIRNQPSLVLLKLDEQAGFEKCAHDIPHQ